MNRTQAIEKLSELLDSTDLQLNYEKGHFMYTETLGELATRAIHDMEAEHYEPDEQLIPPVQYAIDCVIENKPLDEAKLFSEAERYNFEELIS